ncbi:AAA-like domain-containing protein [Crocosphaera sp.]|uniref:AAA-like domain-containing protein n=1 Tax=Crocosphaera sp. TaxID=2729996 RepID=UPI00262BFD32|nr:AAA-like domain-containing protein [Crocosphaera sp.]MDJ0578810.1 AAA-like domain-containing protein [Crocosphaera sp.]
MPTATVLTILKPTPMTSSNPDLSPAPLNIFISYSHRDEKLRETLGLHLSSLQRQGVVKSWHDRKISAGMEWAHAIDENLNSAKIILLLISENFIASDYCYDIEMKRAIIRHEEGEARVIPIILKPVDWSGTPFGRLQALPKDAKPVTTWSNRGEAFLNITEGIKKVAREIAMIMPKKQPAVINQPSAIPNAVELTKINGQKQLNIRETDISVVESYGNFYIVRSRLEKRCYEEVLKPGMLIRIKSPDKMGKSFMMSRVLDSVIQNGYRTAIIDLREVNQQILLNINQFLQWFCAYVSDQLNIDQSPEENWKKFLGANPNCTKYFEKYLLSNTDEPLVIAIDNFDCIFDHPNIETDFCGLLRGWFEKVNTNKVWAKLRQIIVYSQESYGTKDINQSPLNVGFSIELDELDSLQVLALANAYGLSWTEVETEKLMDMIGGHPYLVQMALDRIAHQDIALDELLKIAPTEEGIYGKYLNERLQRLEENPDLAEAMKQGVNSDFPVSLGGKETFKLDSMGLIKRQGNDIVPRCNLYRFYFRDRLR